MYFWSVCFRGELAFLNCDGICMCVVNKQFELLEVFLILFMLTCSMMRFLFFTDGSVCLFGRLWAVLDVALVPYVDAVVAVTVICVLLYVCMLRECEGARLTAMLVW